MTRSRTLLTLAGVVVVMGAVMLVAAGRIKRITPPPPIARGSSSPSPTVPACTEPHIKLTGAFDDPCVTTGATSQACSPAYGTSLDMVITLRGRSHRYLLYVAIDGMYHGPGTYELVPWFQSSLGVRDGTTKVAFREYATGAFWQSVSGTLTVIGNDGRFGTMNANLTFVGGEPTPPTVLLNAAGSWNC
jgi:hypothetical protein